MNDFVSFTVLKQGEKALPEVPFLPKRRGDVHNHALRHVITAAGALGHRVDIAAVKETRAEGCVVRELLIVNGHPSAFHSLRPIALPIEARSVHTPRPWSVARRSISVPRLSSVR